MIALTVPSKFDKYIFCEENETLLEALRARSERIDPSADVSYILGNCDSKIDVICDAIPKGSSKRSVLSLCIVDPFNFGLKFDTLKRIAGSYVDFVVLLAISMDANRNYDHYVQGNSPKIDQALGSRDWRKRWSEAGTPRHSFMTFLAKEFSRSMESLGYLNTPFHRMKLVRSHERNLPLYYLALFSRNQTAHHFWDQVLTYSTDQPSLF